MDLLPKGRILLASHGASVPYLKSSTMIPEKKRNMLFGARFNNVKEEWVEVTDAQTGLKGWVLRIHTSSYNRTTATSPARLSPRKKL